MPTILSARACTRFTCRHLRRHMSLLPEQAPGQKARAGTRTQKSAFPNPVNDSAQFKGGLDEVAIYNRALSDTEVLAHYNAGASGSPGDYPAAVLASDPVAYWRMEEMSTNVSAWAVNAVDSGALPGNYARFISEQHANAGPRPPDI
jgi:hypothetical protein